MQLQFQLGKDDFKMQAITLGQIQKLKSLRLVEQKKIFMINVYLLLGGGTKLTDIANTEDFGYAGDEQETVLINTFFISTSVNSSLQLQEDKIPIHLNFK